MAAMSFLTIGVWFSLNNQIQKNKHAQGLCQDRELEIVRLAVGNLNRSLPESLFPCETH